MRPFTLSVSKVRGAELNNKYRKRTRIQSIDDLKAAVQFDHIAAAMKNDHRMRGNFIEADCILVDLDNGHSEDPGDWKTLDDVAEAFPDVEFCLVRSRHYLKPKEKTDKQGNTRVYAPREKYHFYFPLSETITDKETYENLILSVIGLFPFLDVAAADAAHFFYGVENPYAEHIKGELTIDQYIESLGETRIRETVKASIAEFEQSADTELQEVRKAINKIRPLTGETRPAAELPAEASSGDWVAVAEQRKMLAWFRDFAAQHNIPILKETRINSQNHPDAVSLGVPCPWESEHTVDGGDAESVVIVDLGGRINFLCRHSHGFMYGWKEYRAFYEPQTEQKPRQEDGKSFRKLKAAAELMARDIPEPVVYVGVGCEVPLLVEGTCILSAKPKLGKSWLALCLCLAIAEGADFLGYKTKKCSVLYLDLETSEGIQKKRLLKALDGEEVPKNFYLDTSTDAIDKGFVDQIDSYMNEDPEIGVVVVDVFALIRTEAKSLKESDYSHAYRDIQPLNDLAQKYHIAIILVSHDRKSVDAEDPFSNILGSTGIQGAATQMMVMYRRRRGDPIHISVKGKTIDGVPELDVDLKDGQWTLAEGSSSADREKAQAEMEYKTSVIRAAVLKLVETEPDGKWCGRASQLVQDAVERGIPLTNTARFVGLFLHRQQGRFLEKDSILIKIINNGSGGKSYELSKAAVPVLDTLYKPVQEDFYFVDD